MSKFKAGDRVAVYDSGVRNTGRINAIYANDSVEVRLDSGEYVECHLKQCRLLVKRQRRRYWAKSKEIDDMTCTSYVCPILYRNKANDEYDVELVEVRKKK